MLVDCFVGASKAAEKAEADALLADARAHQQVRGRAVRLRGCRAAAATAAAEGVCVGGGGRAFWVRSGVQSTFLPMWDVGSRLLLLLRRRRRRRRRRSGAGDGRGPAEGPRGEGDVGGGSRGREGIALICGEGGGEGGRESVEHAEPAAEVSI